MARIGIINCSNSTQELDCASVVCLADLRKRRGFFKEYPPDETLELVGNSGELPRPQIGDGHAHPERLQDFSE